MPSLRDETLPAIQGFLANAARPVLVESGEEEFVLEPGNHSVEMAGGALRIHAWSDSRSYSRRITGIQSQRPGRLDLRISRLGRPEGTLTIFDAAHGRSREVERRGQRERQREQFRRMLARQYPGHRIQEISSGADLEHSLSPAYPRAFLTQGTTGIAAICAPADAIDPDGVLTFGLIWLDYLRGRERSVAVPTLAVFVPAKASLTTALRLRWLDPAAANYVLVVHDESGERPVDPKDCGNLVTRLGPPADRASGMAHPEAELERAVRASIRQLDAVLEPSPVYRQAPAIAGSVRGIADLVAVTIDRQLAVLELKASEDVQLPLQALDYWMRVKWHLDHGDFLKLGYFPTVELAAVAPRLYLVAPAFDFHPTTDSVLRYLAAEISVTRLGIGANWREELKVVFRHDRHEHATATS